MTATPQVSVILPVFNREAWLGQALDSVADQTFTDYEVIVVDDGSTDDSCEIALQRSLASNGKIRVVSISNSGVATARNSGIATANGQYFAFLDSDDAWLPNHLENAMTAFEHDPDLGFVHANIERIDIKGRALNVPIRDWARIEDAFEAIALRREHVACSTVVVSREAIKTVGEFDERFNRLGCEDRDLWLRIADRFRICYLDYVGARYRVHPTSLSANSARMHQARRLLVAKLGQAARDHGFLTGMEAMVESDLGLDHLVHQRYGDAIRQQWLAVRIDPGARLLWKRLVRALVTAGRAGISSKRDPVGVRGAP